MTTAKEVMKMIKDNDVKYVDFRFTDPRGKWQHVTFDVSMIEEDTFAEGQMFDGSSIAGWKAIHESDMNLMPDPASAVIDPFFAETTLSLVCDVLEPTTGEPYNRDPRGIAKKAEGIVKAWASATPSISARKPSSSSSTTSSIRPQPYNTGFKLDSVEFPTNSDTDYEGGNLGHHIGFKKGYFPVPPQDTVAGHALGNARRHGAHGRKVEKHHHEVASAQHELGLKFSPHGRHGRPAADLQVLHPRRWRRSTARPRPSCRSRSTATTARACTATSRSGRTASRSFAGNKYADLSETCLSYIAGIIKHAKAINAFTNPTTNSYKRLVPGFEAPVLLAYSARNRSASCRIPYTTNPKAKRVEVRFPDPLANPYLGFAAMLMAGLDGVKNKLDPGPAMDKDLYDLPPAELKQIPTVCGSLRQALEELDKDRAFLKAGGVFDDDFIDSYIELKMTEVIRFEHTPHPVEFEMYYSA